MTTEDRIKAFWLHIEQSLPDDLYGKRALHQIRGHQKAIDHALTIASDPSLCDLCLGTRGTPDSPGFCPRCF